jgi:TRAP-type transport system periplasmic protein
LAVASEALDTLRSQGVTVVNTDKETFRQRVAPQTDNFLKTHPEAKPIVDVIRSTSA